MLKRFVGRTSVRQLVLAGTLAAAFCPAAVLGIGSAIAVRSSSVADQLDRNQALASTFSVTFGRFLGSSERALASVADNVSRLERLDAAEAGPLLGAVRKNFPAVERIFVATPDGRSVAADPEIGPDGRSTLGQSYADRAYFQAILRTGKPAMEGNIIVGRSTGKPVIAIAVPILAANGTVRGVVASGLDISDIQGEVRRLRVGGGSSVGVADTGGRLIALSEGGGARPGTDLSQGELWRAMAGEDSGTIPSYRAEDGEPHLAAFATVPGAGWRVWVADSLERLDSDIKDTYLKVLVWAAGAAAIAVLAAFLFVQQISRPIEALRATATAVASGSLERRAPEAGPLDLVTLGRAINRMGESLEERIAEEQRAAAALQAAVSDYAEFADRVAAGDLRARIDGDNANELGRLAGGLNRMTASIGRLVAEVQNAAGSVASASAEILAATSQQVSATAEEATAVRQTAVTVTEVRQTAEAAARKTRSVADLAQRIASTTDEGRQAVEESVRGSEAGKTRIEALAERILAFSEQAQAIAEINTTVGELAQQSNLLAVNASIEAAKAGEAGKGFGVVAVEVKGLAERCQAATAQVRRIISDIQRSAQVAVIAAEEGVKAAEANTATARRSGEAIAVLARSVGEASQSAQQIMAAAEQQEAGMEQIALAMHNIEQSSAQTVAATQQVEGAARDLNELARRLTEAVGAMTVAPVRQG